MWIVYVEVHKGINVESVMRGGGGIVGYTGIDRVRLVPIG